MRLRKNVRLAYGPAEENHFYYDIEADEPLTEADFEAIEICSEMKQDFKVEHIQKRLTDEESVSFYQQGEFLDLCAGPHIPSPKFIGAFKLLSLAGAYWMGDQDREQLQRLYATAFFTQEDLEAHLGNVEEAKKRDHRVLGKKLGLFHIDEMVGQGLICLLYTSPSPRD